MLALLDDEDLDVREVAAASLRHLGGVATLAVPKLVAFLEDRKTAGMALVTLPRLDPTGEKSIPAIVKSLGSEDVFQRAERIDALGRFRWSGKPASEVRPVLRLLDRIAASGTTYSNGAAARVAKKIRRAAKLNGE